MLDIAGGTCQDRSSLDDSFDGGLLQGAEEVIDMTTTTTSITGEEERRFGFSAFRGGTDGGFFNFGGNGNNEATVEDPFNRNLQGMECPVYQDCPGAGNPYHWCAWICGYWVAGQPRQPRPSGGNGFLRRVMEDLNIAESELEDALEPITYSHEDRELRISIESFVCGWVQRWLDTRFARCLYGATLEVCELDLRSN